MNHLYKISDSLRILTKSKRGIRSIFEKGASIASTQILHSVKHYMPAANTIIDVGANQGQFAVASAYFYPEAKIYSFEPVPDTFEILSKNVASYKNIVTHNFALGSSSGIIEFYSNEHSHASSALPVSDLQAQIFSGTAKQHKIEVRIKKLDEIINQLDLKSPILLKLDVQGFEKEVLMGALETLHKVVYLLFEASFVRLYEGEPLFDEMHDYVKKLGFELVGPVGFLQSDNLQILQMDMLYRRKGAGAVD